MGIGPLGMQPGDVVCVLYGGAFPFVLREVNWGNWPGIYTLVGEVYCDGIMEGEALKMGLPSQDLILA